MTTEQETAALEAEQKATQLEGEVAKAAEAATQAKPTKSAEDWEKEAREARKEAQGLRSRTADAEKRLKELDDAKLSDLEKATKSATELSARSQALEQRLLDSELRNSAIQAGFTDPTDAIKLLDRDKLTVQDGVPVNAKDLFADLGKAKPYLLSGAQVNTNSGRTPDGAADQSLRKESTERIKANFPALAKRMKI